MLLWSGIMPLPKVLPQVSNASHDLEARGDSRTSYCQEAPEHSRQSWVGGGAARVVVNRYQVERKLGSGAFGTAFLISDLKTNKDR